MTDFNDFLHVVSSKNYDHYLRNPLFSEWGGNFTFESMEEGRRKWNGYRNELNVLNNQCPSKRKLPEPKATSLPMLPGIFPRCQVSLRLKLNVEIQEVIEISEKNNLSNRQPVPHRELTSVTNSYFIPKTCE